MVVREIVGPYQYLVLRALLALGSSAARAEINLWIKGQIGRKLRVSHLSGALERLLDLQLVTHISDSEGGYFTIKDEGRNAIKAFEAFMAQVLAK